MEALEECGGGGGIVGEGGEGCSPENVKLEPSDAQLGVQAGGRESPVWRRDVDGYQGGCGRVFGC